jgi:hypothetical protein
MSSLHLAVGVGPQVGTTLVCPPGRPFAVPPYIHLEAIQVEAFRNEINCTNKSYRQYSKKVVILGKIMSCHGSTGTPNTLPAWYSDTVDSQTLTKEDTVAVRAIIPQRYFDCFVHEFLPWDVREVKRCVPDGILRGFGHI